MTLEHIVIAYFVTASMVLLLGAFVLSGGDLHVSGSAQADRAYLTSRAH